MPQLLVRQIEPIIIRRLRRRAAAEGISVEEAHRRVLRQALLGSGEPAGSDFISFLKSMPDVDLPLTRSRAAPRNVRL
jgi:plasmid stability protein